MFADDEGKEILDSSVFKRTKNYGLVVNNRE